MTKIYIKEIIGKNKIVGYMQKKSRRKEFFPITCVARADLIRCGFSVDRVSDATMTELADKMADSYVENVFWIDLDIIAQDLGIPKRKHGTI